MPEQRERVVKEQCVADQHHRGHESVEPQQPLDRLHLLCADELVQSVRTDHQIDRKRSVGDDRRKHRQPVGDILAVRQQQEGQGPPAHDEHGYTQRSSQRDTSFGTGTGDWELGITWGRFPLSSERVKRN